MGSNPYCYFTPFQQDVGRALTALQEQEFRAGRYNPALQAAHPPTYTFDQRFPPGPDFPSPGAQHTSIGAAREDAAEDGTGSILDMVAISTTPGLLLMSPSTHETLVAALATSTPSHDEAARLGNWMGTPRDQLMKLMSFWDPIDRGQGRYFIIYSNGEPSEYFFAGMSVD